MIYVFDEIALAYMGIFLETEQDAADFRQLAEEEFVTRIGIAIGRSERAGEIEPFISGATTEEQQEWYMRNQDMCDALIGVCYDELCKEIIRDKDEMPCVVHEFTPELKATSIDHLKLSRRCSRILSLEGITTVGEILDFENFQELPHSFSHDRDRIMQSVACLIWETEH